MRSSGPRSVVPTSRWRNVGHFRVRLISGLVAVLASACATGLGPKALRGERPDYNEQISRSADAELLLNLVRLRYNEPPLFLELGSVVAQYGYDASLSAGGTIGGGNDAGTLGTTLAYSEKPTVTYTPLAGEDFATRMLTPIPLESIMLFAQSGWSAERLLLVAVQQVNNVLNAPTAGGPTPASKPKYEAFAEFAERFHRLESAGLVGLNWQRSEHKQEPPGRNPHFWIRAPPDRGSPLVRDLVSIRRDLDLEPGRDDFAVIAFPYERKPTEIGIRCRSLLGVLYFLSASVEPPAPDVEAGLVTVTKDDSGGAFDWSNVTGKVMAIHSRKERPKSAYVAVRHGGWWFYIAADDQSSKATFSLLNILFSLQAESGKGRSPLLTLPVGR
jgi:hypothetical protein